MKKTYKISNKTRYIRILTMLCFFNFSGLNNGFTTIAVSVGEMESLSLAPQLVRKSATLLNPLQWNRASFKNIFNKLSFKFPNTVHIASQRAVERMLIESTFLQVWMFDSIEKLTQHVSLYTVGAKDKKSSSLFNWGLVHNPSDTITSDREVRSSNISNIQKQPEWMPLVEVANLFSEQAHIHSNRRHSWLTERLSDWWRDRYRPNQWVPLRLQGNQTISRQDVLDPASKQRLSNFLTFDGTHFVTRHLFSHDSGQEDDSITTLVSNVIPTITLTNLRGDFILSQPHSQRQVIL